MVVCPVDSVVLTFEQLRPDHQTVCFVIETKEIVLRSTVYMNAVLGYGNKE